MKSSRCQELLQYLTQQNGWAATKKLATHFGVSVRTVRTMVSEANSEKEYVLSSRNGYAVNQEYIDEIRESISEGNDESSAETPDERVYAILQALLFSSVPLSIFDLSDKLYVSPEQIAKDLSKVRKCLKENDLELSKVSSGYIVNGTESAKRHVITKMFMSEVNNGDVLSHVMKNIASDERIHSLSDILRTNLKEQELYVNDYAFMALIVHLAVSVSRWSSQAEEGASLPKQIPHDTAEYKAAGKTFRDIEKKYSIRMTKADIDGFAILLMTQTQPVSAYEIKDIRQYVGEQVYGLVNKITSDVLERYHLDLSSKTFFAKFAIHIKNLIYRAQVNRNTQNPYIDTIKQSAPLVYEISVYVANIIHEETKLPVSDDEIAYLALHTGSAMDDKKEDDKLRAVLVCPSYYDLGTKIMERISIHFDREIEITSIVHSEGEILKEKRYDLVFSLIKLNNTPDYVKISPVLGNADFANIEKALKRKKSEISRNQMKQMLSDLFCQDMFFVCDQPVTQEKCLERLCGCMQQKGIVKEDYLEKVYAREKMSSTCSGKVAVPHSLNPSALKNGIAVMIAGEGIEWDDKTVNIVMLLAVSEKDSTLFGDIYNQLVAALYDDEVVEKIIQCRSYDEFIHTMIYEMPE